ncbi:MULTISPECIES: hypothetical protein [Myxococcus]|uniref:Ig-like domain-containing protein n=1 Tax=Myxococcus llanfairpwllgwyngyllgogerychwyrndrobwllllantysiliogogogochensis TaxID=2590453 RepID=A0A540WKN7_9BACT|nr:MULTISPECIES: hypothetical protein [Myxococcus]NTX05306.1 hypothetical protein [Myxococcus sp. CA040A]NTX35294.1 hypothetical protein [Myxococcus sp. CA033]TQF09575.1 hypothetical protein FJV41_43865 [Myxococcus llanfairpwllgwyngyllgogerychwyrndrobwllllantysiliogogogochensis]
MKVSPSVHLPLVLAAALLSVACGGALEEGPDEVEETAIAQGEQALAPLASSISLCTPQGATSPTAFPSFRCLGNASGGTPPYSYSWTGLTHSLVTSWTTNTASSRVSGLCDPDVTARVEFTVTDSLGATASATRSFFCFVVVP